jgi:hypothetical protein
LKRVRDHCNRKIEDAIYKLYNFAAKRELNCTMVELTRNTTLQENMVNAAKETELLERPIIRSSHLISEKRNSNIAIKSPYKIRTMILLRKLPNIKLDELEQYPLMTQLRFIPAIPGEEFDVSTATIIDVGFLGFFPKRIFQVLRHYDREMKRFQSTNNDEFQSLIDNLLAVFIYCPITIQKTVHILLAHQKTLLSEVDAETEENQSGNKTTDHDPLTILPLTNNNTGLHTMSPKCKCFANKCRLLRAKGVIQHQMLCSDGRNMCSGCYNESAKHCRVLQLEQEILTISVNNDTLAQLLEFRIKPIDIKNFRKYLSCLPTYAKQTRDDTIFGATQYTANTLGIMMQDTASSPC